MRLHLDFETRSTADLRKTGVFRYAEDPTTQVIMACWAVDDEPIETWFHLDPVPQHLIDLLENDQCTVVAHNASFERAMIARVLGLSLIHI